MYVELVWDIHFPGKLTRGEVRGRKGRLLVFRVPNNTSQTWYAKWRKGPIVIKETQSKSTSMHV